MKENSAYKEKGIFRDSLPSGYFLKSPSGKTYRILSVLGKGGFGITYRAETVVLEGHISHRVNVAVKEHFLKGYCYRDGYGSGQVLHPADEQARVEKSLRSFKSEARKLSELSASEDGGEFPDIVRVNEIFEANSTAYFVMEYIDGETLRSYVLERGRLDDGQTKTLMLPVIEAVGRLHSNKITHLDIKPDNIMVTVDQDGSPHAILIDFGLAKQYDESGNPVSSLADAAGTAGYMPIEQTAGLKSFSPTADVFALGGTLYFCLTGKNPLPPEVNEPKAMLEGINDSSLCHAVRQSLKPSAPMRPRDANALAKLVKDPSKDTTQTSASGAIGNESNVVFANSSTLEDNPTHAFIEKPLNKRKKYIVAASIFFSLAVIIAFVNLTFKESKPSDIIIAKGDALVDSVEKTSQSNPPVKIIDVAERRRSTPREFDKAGESQHKEVSGKTPSKTAQPQKSLDEMYATAKTLEDFQELADQNYAPAYAPLASKYLQQKNYRKADAYLKKAKKARVNVAEAKLVYTELFNLGYYDDKRNETVTWE